MERFTNLTPQQLRHAANIKERIDELEAELGSLLGAPSRAVTKPAPGRRQISAAGIARIRAAQKARWAAARNKPGAAKATSKPKRKISAAGRRRLSALTKARWAKLKASGKKSL